MSASMIHELFRGLERTIHERLAIIEELVQRPQAAVASNPLQEKVDAMAERITELEAQVRNLRVENSPLIPLHPLNGIEVVPKREVVITGVSPEPLSMADRLLLNTSAREALEKADEEEEDCTQDIVEEEQEEEQEEEFVEEFVEEEEEEEEEDAEELSSFEYKGATYYRDSDNSVFMTDDEGELIPTPIGVWSEVKKRIIVKKPE
jgi:hypothetical protein